MKFHEAALNMNTGDVFKPDDNSPAIILSNDGSFNLFDKGGALVMMSKQYLGLEGEIIPAEPKVLTAEKYIYDNFDGIKALDKDDEHEFSYTEMIHCFDEGVEKGRLERDLELKPFIKCISDNIESLARDGYECIVEFQRE